MEGGLQTEQVVACEESDKLAELERVTLRRGVVAQAALACARREEGEMMGYEGGEGGEDKGAAKLEFI